MATNSFDIASLRKNLGLGARPNLFEVTFANGLVAGATSTVSILCKSAALPGSSVGTIEVPHNGGRRLKLAGDVTFADWTITVMNDRNHAARKACIDYQDLMFNNNFNEAALAARGTTSRTEVTVKQLSETGAAVRTYTLKNAFITNISGVDLSYDSTDAQSEFTVTWVYDYFTTTAGSYAVSGETASV